MNINDDVIREWFYRLPKGYAEAPYSESELFVLADVIAEHDSNVGKSIPEAVELVTEDEDQPNSTDVQEVPEKSVTDLIQAIKEVAEQYSKYLSIFYYFDPSSLGTISEVLLAKLLNKDTNIEAIHTGASGGLADLVVAGIPISLKTTASGKNIRLGSDELQVPKGTVRAVAKELRDLRDQGLDVENVPIKELGPGLERIQSRINAIADKLAGPDNKEVFVWAEKKYKNKILNKIIIHIHDFNKKEIIDIFNNGYIYITDLPVWGIKSEAGNIIVSADQGLNALNIHPRFLDLVTDKEEIEIDLPTPKISKEFLTQVKKDIPDRLFNALDDIYADIFNTTE
jgi:hypothetical protein